jgi:hypothetical protein
MNQENKPQLSRTEFTMLSCFKISLEENDTVVVLWCPSEPSGLMVFIGGAMEEIEGVFPRDRESMVAWVAREKQKSVVLEVSAQYDPKIKDYDYSAVRHFVS